uniref:Uncharacterized protein n=1 Tax=Rhizophora mucronata TaxID=61149 RepID=A0A2P2PJW4_RHIMU
MLFKTQHYHIVLICFYPCICFIWKGQEEIMQCGLFSLYGCFSTFFSGAKSN